jgi:hypothetical protein
MDEGQDYYEQTTEQSFVSESQEMLAGLRKRLKLAEERRATCSSALKEAERIMAACTAAIEKLDPPQVAAAKDFAKKVSTAPGVVARY